MGWGGLGKFQRSWVLARDDYKCQHFEYNTIFKEWWQCKNTKDLHVHHIYPVRWLRYHFCWVDPHRPHNLITLCKEHHLGASGVHPEMARALERYREGDKLAFDDMVAIHRELTEEGVVYWNTAWDLMYLRRARSQTQKYKINFPEKKRRRDWVRPRRR